MKAQAAPSADSTSLAGDTPSNSPVVIDLGKKRKKQIRDLRRGKAGKLMNEVSEALEILQSQGAVAANVQPIVVVVREKRKRGRNVLGVGGF